MVVRKREREVKQARGERSGAGDRLDGVGRVVG